MSLSGFNPPFAFRGESMRYPDCAPKGSRWCVRWRYKGDPLVTDFTRLDEALAHARSVMIDWEKDNIKRIVISLEKVV